MSSAARIYLDNAATSWPKPEAVYAAVDRYHRDCGAAVGRATTEQGTSVQTIVDRCRERAARLLGAPSAERIVFTFNGTDSLNLAIHGILSPGDHVITSVVEHNSVLRPLRAAADRLDVSITYLPVGSTGVVNPDDVAAAIGPDTKLVALSHASNVTGIVQPVADVAEIVAETDALFLLDAAQTAGHLPIDASSLPVDLLACSGHKGLLGPLGTGLLYVREGIEERLRPLRQGGTGSQSETDEQPTSMPDRYESGNHNAPGLVGLDAALAWIEEKTVDALHQQELALRQRLVAALQDVPNITLFGAGDEQACVGVVSLTVEKLAPQEVATILDQNFAIETRAGFHCAPRIHQALGTQDRGGTVRLSSGPFTTTEQIDTAVSALREIAASTSSA